MEIDSAIRQRLIEAQQEHLLTYWNELNNQQRQTLLHDINEIDFDRVRKAFDGIRHELSADAAALNKDTVQQDAKKDSKQESIDDLMEPVPDHMAGSIDEASETELENYRQKGALDSHAEKNTIVALH